MCLCLVWPFRSLSSLSEVLDGITGGNNAVAQAYLTDITTKEEKNTIFGTLGGIVGIGFIIGPGVGGYLASGSYGYLGMVIGATCLSTVTLLSIAFGLKESLLPENRRPRTQESILNSLRLIHRIKRLNPAPIIVNIFTIRAVFNIMMSAYIATIALFMIDLFQFNEQEPGPLYAGGWGIHRIQSSHHLKMVHPKNRRIPNHATGHFSVHFWPCQHHIDRQSVVVHWTVLLPQPWDLIDHSLLQYPARTACRPHRSR